MRIIGIIFLLLAITTADVFSQARNWRVHRRGLLHQSVYNTGELGRAYNAGGSDATVSESSPSMEYPPYSKMTLDDFIGEYHITQADSEYLYAQWADGRNGDYNDLYFSKALLSDLAVTEYEDNDLQVDRILEVPGIWHGNVLLRIQPHEYPVNINAYDVSGRMIKHIYAGLVSQPMQIQLDHNDFPQGVIFLQVSSSLLNESCKVVNLK